eukprot:1181235-Prorocentrum_minimum.AAC.2
MAQTGLPARPPPGPPPRPPSDPCRALSGLARTSWYGSTRTRGPREYFRGRIEFSSGGVA